MNGIVCQSHKYNVAPVVLYTTNVWQQALVVSDQVPAARYFAICSPLFCKAAVIEEILVKVNAPSE